MYSLYCILPLFPKSYRSGRSSSHHYSSPLLRSDTAQASWAGRAPPSHLPPPCLQLAFDPHLQPLLDSPPSSLPLAHSDILQHHPVPGGRAAGATSTSIPAGLLASSILLFACGASGLCSFLDISSRCSPWEMCNPSSQIPVGSISFIRLCLALKSPERGNYTCSFLSLTHVEFHLLPSAFCSISRFSLFNKYDHLCLSLHQSLAVSLPCFFCTAKPIKTFWTFLTTHASTAECCQAAHPATGVITAVPVLFVPTIVSSDSGSLLQAGPFPPALEMWDMLQSRLK